MSRRSRAQAHARRPHACPRCGKVCLGNGYRNHVKACRLHIRYADVAWCGVKIGPKTRTIEGAPDATAKDICPTCLARRADRMAPTVNGGARPMLPGEVAPAEIAATVEKETRRSLQAMENAGVPLEALFNFEPGGTP